MKPIVFEAIGTRWQIDIREAFPPETLEEVLVSIHARIEGFDRLYSRFRSDSWVTKMCREAGTFPMPSDLGPMLDLYKELYNLTDGAMTPLIGQVLADAGYDADYSLTQVGKLASPPKWEEVLEYTDSVITFKKPVLLDFGAMGKGYLIDIVSGVLGAREIASFSIDAGGDMLVRGASIDVGLEDPKDITKVVGTVTLENESLCGSAGNRRVWGKFHHIISPKTLSSPRHIEAVWVRAESTMLADALATALFFVDAKVLGSHYTFEYLVLYPDRTVEASRAFSANLFHA